MKFNELISAITGMNEYLLARTVRNINLSLTLRNWLTGLYIVEFEQNGEDRATYGDRLLREIAGHCIEHGLHGFSFTSLTIFRRFYQTYPHIVQTLSEQFCKRTGLPIVRTASEQFVALQICQTLSGNSPTDPIQQTPSAESEICGTVSRKSDGAAKLPMTSAKSLIPISATLSRKCGTSSRSSSIDLALYLESLRHAFPLSWSHYVRLLSVEQPEARKFYEAEALRGGWSVRQLDRQISTLFYERTALSKNKAKLLTAGAQARPEDAVSVEEEIKSPYILEFLNLRDDYAESELEDSLVRHLEAFLLELGNNFTFVARQKRIRVGKEWYRIDLLLFHRRLRCLVIIDLKVGRFTHADAGQMNLYVNYAAEHLTLTEENPPVGLVLCSEHDEAVAYYAMGNLRNKILAAQYKLNLPDPRTLESEIEKMRRLLESPAHRLRRK